MDLLTKDLLINLLFIISSLFIIQFWYDKTKKVPSKCLITTVSSFSIILCMIFSQQLPNESLFSLQKIPFIIGTLYGGWKSSIVLVMIMIIFRVFFHLDGLLEMTLVYSISFLILIPLSKKFKSLSSNKRILLTSTISLAMPLIPGFFMFIIPLNASPGFTMYEQALYIIVPTVGIVIVTYLAEKIRQNIFLQQKMMKAERLEAISHLAASISHEVRNPLTAAKGFMELVEQYDLPREKRKEYLKIGIQELNQAERIISDYLTFAKQADENFTERIQVEAELKGVLDVLHPMANMNSVIISFSPVPSTIYGNKTKFRQCLMNILKNSIEAMPNGGTLTVSMNADTSKLMLHISDTGSGMNKEQLAKIGEPYYSTKGMKGTGLGMMVVFGVISSLNGTIDIKSKLGKGTSVYICLPLIANDNEEK